MENFKKNIEKINKLQKENMDSKFFEETGEIFFFYGKSRYSFDKNLRSWGGISYRRDLSKINEFNDNKRGEFIKDFTLIEILIDHIILIKIDAFSSLEKLIMNRFILKKMSLSNHKVSFLKEFNIFSNDKIYSKIRKIEKLRNSMAHLYRLNNIKYPENSEKKELDMLEEMNDDWNFIMKNIVIFLKKEQNIIFKFIFNNYK